jgi:N-carbamoyl-L-amino-acid hydrolase
VLRTRGFRPTRPIGISVFVEEEGSRFGMACLGSRLATGSVAWESARGLRDRDGVRLDEAMAELGLTGENPQPWLGSERIGCFVELHVEQGRDLVDRGVPIGVAGRIWPHGRYRFEFSGSPNHAGTTRMEDRHDPMLGYAMTALAANKQARVAGQRATFGRVETRPNSTNSVPSAVTAWMDARGETAQALADLVATITRQAEERTARDGTRLTVTAESVSGAVDFDADLAHRIAADHETGEWPIVATQAGHDAGILSAHGIPSAMLFVRNPTGVSHSPAEHAETPDCLAGVDALAETLERLAS